MNIKKFGCTKYKLRILDFPGEIGRNLCFLTKHSLYLLVWDGNNEDDLESWLNCLISHAKGSVVMIVVPWDRQDKDLERHLKEYLKKFEAAKDWLKFGVWKRESERNEMLNERWFACLDLSKPKG